MLGFSGVAAARLDAAAPRVVEAGSFFVGAVLVLEPRVDVPEARPFDLVLVAMLPTLRPPTGSRREDAASVCDRLRAQG